MAYLCLMDFDKLPKIKIDGFDKSVHFVLHFFFTIFWYLHLTTVKINPRYRMLVAIAASVLYGSLIEIAQGLWTTTRKADIIDVLANSVGTVGGCIAICIVWRYAAKKI